MRMTLSSVKRLQSLGRLERLDTLIEKQTTQLRQAELGGWSTAQIERSLKNLLDTRELYRRTLGLPADTSDSSNDRD